ncbi:hypothetical protein EWM64_g7220 [Hericium alpestre]|uniref:Uncharacterized protein n=1 Tax=Hericium alpestre TaxID=135208 RepID=A0A4Y9ZPT7_9AGAM|nr:hypothetical protein EWM64_g7220 [Hericium alpestre]
MTRYAISSELSLFDSGTHISMLLSYVSPQRTLVAASNRGPVCGSLAADAGAVELTAAIGARPLAARHLGKGAGQRAMARWEERIRRARVFTQVEAAAMS